MTTSRKAINEAQSWVGTVEKPTNDVIFNTWFYGHRVNGLNYAWCAVFLSYVFDKIGLDYIRFAGVDYGMAKFKSGEWGRWSEKPVKGALAFYGSDADGVHVGLCIDTQPFTTIEGNTSPDNSGSQTNGGGVYIRTRPLNSWVIGFGVPKYYEKKLWVIFGTKKKRRVVRGRARARAVAAIWRARGYDTRIREKSG